MQITTNNYTLRKFDDEKERYVWIGFLVIAVVSSVIGDSLILVASLNLKYKAFKLHRIVVAMIQHIAVSDLLMTVTLLFPEVISLMAGRWVLGDWLCRLRPYLGSFSFSSNILLICVMTTSKLVWLLNPIRARSWSTRRAHIAAGCMWVLAALIGSPGPGLMFALDPTFEGIFYDHRIFACHMTFLNPVWRWLMPIVGIVMVMIPNLIVVVTTVLLLVMACKVARRGKKKERLQLRGIITVVLTAVVFMISSMPWVVFLNVELKIPPESAYFHNQFYRIALYLLALNAMGNFFIYAFTIPSFKEFLKSRLVMIASYLHLISTDHDHMAGQCASSLAAGNSDQFRTDRTPV